MAGDEMAEVIGTAPVASLAHPARGVQAYAGTGSTIRRTGRLLRWGGARRAWQAAASSRVLSITAR